MKVFIDDRGRYKQNSGYGNLSRNLAIALSDSGCTVVFEKYDDMPWDKELTPRKLELFNQQLRYGVSEDVDVVLTVSSPCERKYFDKPNLLYTQNALKGMIQEWSTYCKAYDGIIIPGEFDRDNFASSAKQLFVCPQLVDNHLFSSRPDWRNEGGEKFTFIYIGSLSYRKGVDLLLESFCKFSALEGNDSKLQLFVSGAVHINLILNYLRTCNPYADIEVDVQFYSSEWIARFLNRADVFVSLSRGEGWCMPLSESLLCEKPAIISKSTAMDECIQSDSVIKVPVIERPVDEATSSFASGFHKRYSNQNVYSYDAQVTKAVEAMREMKNNYSHYLAGTERGRKYILKNYNRKTVGKNLQSILSKFI